MKLEQEISARIKELRLAKKMTQEELANKIDIDVSFLGRIERGKSANIQINTLEKIIKALDEDYLTFFSFKDTENRNVALINKISVSQNKEELLDVIERIIELDKK